MEKKKKKTKHDKIIYGIVFLLFPSFWSLYLNKRRDSRDGENPYVSKHSQTKWASEKKSNHCFTTQKRRFQTTIRVNIGNCVVSNPTTPFLFLLFSFSLIWWCLYLVVRWGANTTPHHSFFPSQHKPHKN